MKGRDNHPSIPFPILRIENILSNNHIILSDALLIIPHLVHIKNIRLYIACIVHRMRRQRLQLIKIGRNKEADAIYSLLAEEFNFNVIINY